jgi:RecB family exonuclease
VLEATLRRLRDATGSAALTPASLPAALEALDAALDGIELDGARGAAARRTLEADLQRYLRHEAERGAGMEPTQLEWRFGREGDEHGPLALGDLSITGRVDRVDVGPGGEAIVRDYKGASAYPGASWVEGGYVQVALYMLAARELLGLEPVGGLYQALWSRDSRPRGLVRDDVPGTYVGNDVVSEAELEAALEDVRERALATARELQAGAVKACPERCTPNGCAYPTICRAGG